MNLGTYIPIHHRDFERIEKFATEVFNEIDSDSPLFTEASVIIDLLELTKTNEIARRKSASDWPVRTSHPHGIG